MTDWQKIRRDFPVTENGVYFISAAMSPPPRPVYDILMQNYDFFFRHGDIEWEKDLETRRGLYETLGRLLNTSPDNITFTANTSTAMSLIGQSMKNRIAPPFHLVSLQDEFPASTVGFEHLGIPMRYIQPLENRYAIDAILEWTDNETLAVIVSYVQYSTGFRLDLEALGKSLKERGVFLIVNATQGFPFYPLDAEAMGIGALTASLHKWAMCGHIGTLFCTSPEFRTHFPSPFAGWLGINAGDGSIHTKKNTPFHLYDSASQYELGTSNLQALLALPAALEYMEGIGFDNIRRRLEELGDSLISGLNKKRIEVVSPVENRNERSAIIAFTLGDQNREIVEKLEKQKIFVSYRNGAIRAALNIFNDHSDIDTLLTALEELR